MYSNRIIKCNFRFIPQQLLNFTFVINNFQIAFGFSIEKCPVHLLDTFITSMFIRNLTLKIIQPCLVNLKQSSNMTAVIQSNFKQNLRTWPQWSNLKPFELLRHVGSTTKIYHYLVKSDYLWGYTDTKVLFLNVSVMVYPQRYC